MNFRILLAVDSEVAGMKMNKALVNQALAEMGIYAASNFECRAPLGTVMAHLSVSSFVVVNIA